MLLRDVRGNHFLGTLAGHRPTSQLIHSTRRDPCPLSPACRSRCRLQSFHRCYHSKASAERALDGRSLPPNVDTKTRPKTHEHTPNDSQRTTDIPPVTLSREVGMIIVVTIVHTLVPSAAALPPPAHRAHAAGQRLPAPRPNAHVVSRPLPAGKLRTTLRCFSNTCRPRILVKRSAGLVSPGRCRPRPDVRGRSRWRGA